MPFLGFLTRARVRPLLRRALARAASVAALLPAGAASRSPGRSAPSSSSAASSRTAASSSTSPPAGRSPASSSPCIALACGLAWSPVVKLPRPVRRLSGLGEPLLFQWLVDRRCRPRRATAGRSTCTRRRSPAGSACSSPMMNLVPISQLDGGHIAYAAAPPPQPLADGGRPGHAGHLGIVWLQAYTWALWLVLLLVIMRLVGWEHPPSARRRRCRSTRRASRWPLVARRHLRRLLHAGAAVADRADRRPAARSPHAGVTTSSADRRRPSSDGPASDAAPSARCTAWRIAARFVPFRMTWTRKSPRRRGSGAAAGPSTSNGGRPARSARASVAASRIAPSAVADRDHDVHQRQRRRIVHRPPVGQLGLEERARSPAAPPAPTP